MPRCRAAEPHISAALRSPGTFLRQTVIGIHFDQCREDLDIVALKDIASLNDPLRKIPEDVLCRRCIGLTASRFVPDGVMRRP